MTKNGPICPACGEPVEPGDVTTFDVAVPAQPPGCVTIIAAAVPGRRVRELRAEHGAQTRISVHWLAGAAPAQLDALADLSWGLA